MKRLVLVLAIALLTAGCGGGEDISIGGQWARNSPQNAEAGAVYMDITSSDGDRLLSAGVDSSIAATVEVHETMPADEGSSEEEGMGMMVMQEVDAIELPAGETVSLEPGGYHIMLLNITRPLEIGDTFDVTLEFEKNGEMVVEVEVHEQAP